MIGDMAFWNHLRIVSSKTHYVIVGPLCEYVACVKLQAAQLAKSGGLQSHGKVRR